MAENTNKPTIVGKIFRILGYVVAAAAVFAAGVEASDTKLGHKVDGAVKAAGRKIGLGKDKDETSSSDQERDKDRQ
jgi:hypothetical protein